MDFSEDKNATGGGGGFFDGRQRRAAPPDEFEEENIVYDDGEYEYVEVDADSPEGESGETYEFIDDDGGDIEMPPPPPPPFGVMPPPPPPPFGMMPPPLPPPFPQAAPPYFITPPVVPMFEDEYGAEVEYGEFERYASADEASDYYGDLDDAEFFIDSENEALEADEEDEVFAAPLSDMKSDAESKLLEIGEKQGEAVKSGKFFLLFGGVCKFAMSIVLVAFICLGIFYMVVSLVDSAPDDQKAIETRDAPVGNFSWRLPHGRVRTCLEGFYKSIGMPQNYISADDILFNGSIVLGGQKQNIYCIKKRIDNKVFIKIGTGTTSKTYLVGSGDEPVLRLIDGGMSGAKREIAPEFGRVVASFTAFDDPIFFRAFSRDYGETVNNPFAYEGEAKVEGADCQSISATEDDGTKITFYFENKTGRICKASYLFKTQKIDILYSDYKPIDEEQSRPFTRKIFVNSKLYATIEFTFVVKRNGLIFPN